MSITVSGTAITFNDSTTQAYPSKIGQVVNTVQTASITSSSVNTWTALSGFSASITPKFTSSKVLIIVSCSVSSNGNSRSNMNNKVIRLLRNGSVIGAGTPRGGEPVGLTGGSMNFDASVSTPIGGIYLDSPGTTSACSYTLEMYGADYYWTVGGTYNTTAVLGFSGLSSPNCITLMEVLP